jgi:hypothetical protein
MVYVGISFRVEGLFVLRPVADFEFVWVFNPWTKNSLLLLIIEGVSEIGALILTGNRTHQKEQLFSLPFWRKTLRNGLKK